MFPVTKFCLTGVFCLRHFHVFCVVFFPDFESLVAEKHDFGDFWRALKLRSCRREPHWAACLRVESLKVQKVS